MNNDIDFSWPNRQLAAVSLTFDDGLQSQLDLAVPILEECAVRGTFYVNPEDGFGAGTDALARCGCSRA